MIKYSRKDGDSKSTTLSLGIPVHMVRVPTYKRDRGCTRRPNKNFRTPLVEDNRVRLKPNETENLFRRLVLVLSERDERSR